MADDISTEKLRLFVAIPMPEPVRKEIVGVQQELQRLVPRGAVRWARPEQFHLTLRFLGDVFSDRVTGLQEAVRTVCSGTTTLHLRAQGVGSFPKARSPRVIWVGVNDDEGRLAELQKKIESAVRRFKAEQAAERFAGHVTLGRFKFVNRLDTSELTASAESMKDRLFGEWTAREVEIIRSELSPTGARYTLLAAFPLGGKD